jgi:transposase/Trp operon repressor
MFIRKTQKKDPKTKKLYHSYQLIESVRTERGPRQHILLNLSNIELSDLERKSLANRIEEITTGSNSLFTYPENIEKLAQYFAKMLIRKDSIQLPDIPKEGDFHTVDINSIEHDNMRTTGLEHICFETFKKLELDSKLQKIGFTNRQIELTIALIIGRLAGKISELSTYQWLQGASALDELLETSFKTLSLNSVYKTGDTLYKNKKDIEDHLREKEANLFSLKNTIALYDLTNTYFEGSAQGVSKAKKSRSKEKRSDCPLVTLGVVFNPEGFPLTTEIFDGNVSEPKTLETAINKLNNQTIKPIIVLDAGLATEDNIKWLQTEKYPYIVCSRKRNQTFPEDLNFEIVKEKKEQTVRAACVKNLSTNETLVYCQSEATKASEQKWSAHAQKKFEAGLKKMADGLLKKNCTKSYKILLERLGRLKQRYRRISQFYNVEITPDEVGVNTKSISWNFDEKGLDDRFNGGYCLRVHLLEWKSKELWETYIMLTEAENGFRCLKGALGLRPIFHQKGSRVDSHLFITVLAYHIMQTILHQLKEHGINLRWETLRSYMNTQARITTSFQDKNSKKIRVRSTTNPEEIHKQICAALKVVTKPGKKVKSIH